MPKGTTGNLINIDLLKPQSSTQKILFKAIKWLLSAGRYIVIFVEIIVLAAFLTRFKIDADIANTSDDIGKLSPYVESLKPTEVLIKKTQFQLSTINSIKDQSVAFEEILKKISDQTPAGVSLTNTNLELDSGKVVLKINGVAKNNLELSTFVYGLKTDKNFSDINIANVDLEGANLNFSIIGSYNK